MLIVESSGFSRDFIAEIGRKDTTILFNRCNFIEKLTLYAAKKTVSRC